jgi:Cu+-exporting ATPase
VFQQKTHERLVFDRDFKSFFPLSVVRKTAVGEESVSISNLSVGDKLILRNGELIPADAKLINGAAFIDYSFVTGESEPLAKREGDYLYAGGKQIGAAIELETLKPVSHSYLTSLWNHEAFQKDRDDNLNTLTNVYSRRFTFIVIAVALGAAVFWAASGNLPRGIKAFTSVLIVACPCVLALAAPFTLGTAQRLLARLKIFLKNALVIERMARVDAIVFDKTGTLTSSGASAVKFVAAGVPPAIEGGILPPGSSHDISSPLECRTFLPPGGTPSSTAGRMPAATMLPLTAIEESWIYSLTRHSTHPYSARIAESLAENYSALTVSKFCETSGYGIEGQVQGREIWIGSRAWLESRGVCVGQASSLSQEYSVQIHLKNGGRQDACPTLGNAAHVAIDGQYRGAVCGR